MNIFSLTILRVNMQIALKVSKIKTNYVARLIQTFDH